MPLAASSFGYLRVWSLFVHSYATQFFGLYVNLMLILSGDEHRPTVEQLASLQSSHSMLDSRSESLSFSQLPLEILHGIFHYLNIPDILRIRRVRDTFVHPIRRALT